MRIISKFHDYYDSVQSIGYDPNLIYHRVQDDARIEIKYNNYVYKNMADRFDMPFYMPSFSESFIDMLSSRNMRRSRVMPQEATLWLIGFCGKFYLILEVIERFRDYSSRHEFFYDKDSAVKWHTRRKLETNYRIFDMLGESKINPFHDVIEPFRVINAPAFSINMLDKYSIFKDKTMTVNPDLSRFKFYKVFDTYMAYQELAMFLSGVLGWPENATVQISDTDMRDAKGFDEWSFKTLPTKKRK